MLDSVSGKQSADWAVLGAVVDWSGSVHCTHSTVHSVEGSQGRQLGSESPHLGRQGEMGH